MQLGEGEKTKNEKNERKRKERKMQLSDDAIKLRALVLTKVTTRLDSTDYTASCEEEMGCSQLKMLFKALGMSKKNMV